MGRRMIEIASDCPHLGRDRGRPSVRHLDRLGGAGGQAAHRVSAQAPYRTKHFLHRVPSARRKRSCRGGSSGGTLPGLPHQQRFDKPRNREAQSLRREGRGDSWRRGWRLPAHVFFSHRVHVAIAKLDCQSCHGPMETLDRPPPRPLKTLDMDECIACHMKTRSTSEREAKVKPAAHVSSRRLINDCNVCHR